MCPEVKENNCCWCWVLLVFENIKSNRPSTCPRLPQGLHWGGGSRASDLGWGAPSFSQETPTSGGFHDLPSYGCPCNTCWKRHKSPVLGRTDRQFQWVSGPRAACRGRRGQKITGRGRAEIKVPVWPHPGRGMGRWGERTGSGSGVKPGCSSSTWHEPPDRSAKGLQPGSAEGWDPKDRGEQEQAGGCWDQCQGQPHQAAHPVCHSEAELRMGCAAGLTWPWTLVLQLILCIFKPTDELQEKFNRETFLRYPVVKTSPSNAGDMGSIPGQGTKIPTWILKSLLGLP